MKEGGIDRTRGRQIIQVDMKMLGKEVGGEGKLWVEV